MIDPLMIASPNQLEPLRTIVCTMTKFALPLYRGPLGAVFRFLVGDNAHVAPGCCVAYVMVEARKAWRFWLNTYCEMCCRESRATRSLTERLWLPENFSADFVEGECQNGEFRGSIGTEIPWGRDESALRSGAGLILECAYSDALR